jgi:hypothetical protein
MSKAGAPKGNKNAEKWTLKEATDFFKKALELSYNGDYDFEGEIYKDMKSYKYLVYHLIERFPELKVYHYYIKNNCEVNCYKNGKRGNIDKSLAIMNLKSNHNWKDRQDITSGDDKIQSDTKYIIVDGTGKS